MKNIHLPVHFEEILVNVRVHGTTALYVLYSCGLRVSIGPMKYAADRYHNHSRYQILP